ncbi:MAG: phospho-N-acetylmuramoyl-pentapeptide-transferase [Clostridiales Family XIII bacterium]|jgi:phospho-N-acetylmuramoyl-pentapeptide-transferase|nr:phospho-N-acetylmuramoyl-pentapeptide-transferase [Clostridiales Family XIII bacterium]
MMKLGLELMGKAMLPLLAAMLVTMAVTWRLIPYLKKMHSTQTILDEAPEAHKKKSGTPTMGGVAILAGILAGCVFSLLTMGFSAGFSEAFSLNLLVMLVVVFLFGMVGFLDDYRKVSRKQNLGLTARQKMAFQLLVSLLLALYYVFVADLGTRILIPFVWARVDIGYFIIPYIMFIVVAMVNAVNLTDGLDGLAAGVTSVFSLFFPLITILALASFPTDADEVGLILTGSVDAMFFFSVAGACLGFLFFNRNPARIFMGDTGSLALGGGLAVGAILVKMELFLPVCGLIFVLEALSDIIQVAYFKATKGKRFFKMAPLHHHFELTGWPERRVVSVFTGVTLVLCAASLGIMMWKYASVVNG